MQNPSPHPRELERLAALRGLHLLDTPPEPEFDDLVVAARALCGTSIALVSLVDVERQWFKARVGLDATETSRDVSFCGHAILSDEPLIVTDARRDERFVGNPLVDGPPHVVAYAGFPLVDAGTGLSMGTLCVIDATPRTFTDAQLEGLAALARTAERMLNGRVRAMEQEIRRMESDIVLDHVPVGVFLAGEHGGLRYANAGFEMMADRAFEAGVPWTEMLEVDAPVVAAWSRRPVGHRFAADVVTPERRLKVSTVPVVIEGAEVGVVGVVQDVTTAARLSSALAESEAQLREAQSIAAIGHWRFTIATQDIAWSSALYGIFGRNPRLGPPDFAAYMESVAPADRERLGSVIRAAVNEAVPFDAEHGVVWPDGSIRHVHSRGRPMVDASGRVTALMGTAQDVTAAVQAREALEQARRDAEAGARAKADFLATMSHEIRTPLNGVTGMINLLLGTELSPEQRHYADQATNCSHALLALINDILDLSKIEAGKVDLERHPFSVRQLLDDTLPVVAANAQRKGVEVYATFTAQSDRWLIGDTGRLRQVLTNLVGNAVKFTAAGEVRADVDWTDGRLDVRVTDTGVGITVEQISRLFQPFSQADSSTTRKFGGTGLGLAICRRLIEQMGGEIGVESVEGAGSTFWFRVPLEEASPSETAPVAKARVLVGELHPGSRAATVDLLRRVGVDAVAVERLEGFHGQRADVAIVDRRWLGVDATAGLAALRDQAPGLERVVVLVDGANPASLPSGVSSLLRPVGRAAVLDGLSRWGRRSEPVAAPATPTGVSRLQVLVAEDNPVNQMVATGMLRRLGCLVDVVPDGRQAVEACRRRPYDIVFMDCLMPEMDGYEATEALRADPSTRGLFVVALTANALEGDRQRCLQSGMDEFLAKPIDPVALRRMVETRACVA
jgi:two-component system sensor histidine kinase/response regulator